MFDAVDQIQHECLTEAIYFESRGEEFSGQVFVGSVIRNRVDSPLFPDTYCEVIAQHKQFSYIFEIKDHTMLDKESERVAKEVAYSIMTVDRVPLPVDTFFYHADYVWPNWHWDKLEMVAVRGRHIFYRYHNGNYLAYEQ